MISTHPLSTTAGRRRAPRPAHCLVVLACAGCDGAQSSLAPGGPDARHIAGLFWWMSGASALIWLAVMGLTLYAARRVPQGACDQKRARSLVLWAGVVVPTLLLTVLLIYGLSMLPPLLAQPSRERGSIHVTGEQWWWRVRYSSAHGEAFELANELRIPVGVRVPISLSARDVIHSFWVPSLAGKKDMIPGRVTQLPLVADRKGVYLGACAEFCGDAHAQMRFHVVVLEGSEYEAWLAQQRQPARSSEGELARRGQVLFREVGCGACHTVRGTEARGRLGPDLTHVGSRLAIGGAVLPNQRSSLHAWIEQPARLKPAVHMPAYAALPGASVTALAAYLEGLR